MSEVIKQIQPHPIGGFYSYGGTKYTGSWYGRDYGPSIFSLENLNAGTGGNFGSIVSGGGETLAAIRGAASVTKIVGKAIGVLGVGIDIYSRSADEGGFTGVSQRLSRL